MMLHTQGRQGDRERRGEIQREGKVYIDREETEKRVGGSAVFCQKCKAKCHAVMLPSPLAMPHVVASLGRASRRPLPAGQKVVSAV